VASFKRGLRTLEISPLDTKQTSSMVSHSIYLDLQLNAGIFVWNAISNYPLKHISRNAPKRFPSTLWFTCACLRFRHQQLSHRLPETRWAALIKHSNATPPAWTTIGSSILGTARCFLTSFAIGALERRDSSSVISGAVPLKLGQVFHELFSCSVSHLHVWLHRSSNIHFRDRDRRCASISFTFHSAKVCAANDAGFAETTNTNTW